MKAKQLIWILIIVLFSLGLKFKDNDIVFYIQSYNNGQITSDSIVKLLRDYQFYFCVPKSTVNSENGFIQLNSPIKTISKDEHTYLAIYTTKEYEKEIRNDIKYNALGKVDILKYLKIYSGMNICLVFNPNFENSIWLNSEKSKILINSIVNYNNLELQNITSKIKSTPCFFDGKEDIALNSCKISAIPEEKFSYFSSKDCDENTFVMTNESKIIFNKSDSFEIVKISNDTILKVYENRKEYFTTHSYYGTHDDYKIFGLESSNEKYAILNMNKIDDIVEVFIISNKK